MPMRRTASPARVLLHRRGLRYVLTLVLLVVMALGSFLAVERADHGLQDDGHRINIAGRQRMLNQQIANRTNLALYAPLATDRAAARDAITAAVTRMRTENRALIEGDPSLGLAAPDPETAARYDGLEDRLVDYWADAALVASSTTVTGGTTSSPVDPEAALARAAADRVRRTADDIAIDLDAVVTQYEADSRDGQDHLRRTIRTAGLALLLSALILLIPLGMSLRRERAALRASRTQALDRELFMNAVLDTMDVAVAASGPDGRLTLVNRFGREVFGARAGEQLPAWAATGQPSADEAGTRTPAQDRTTVREFVNRRPDAPARHLVMQGRTLRGSDGTVLGAVTAAHDVTTLKDREAELLASNLAIAELKAFDEAVLESVTTGVLAVDTRARVVLRNSAHRRMTGAADRAGPIHTRGRPPLAATVTPHLLFADGSPVPVEGSPLERTLSGQEVTGLSVRLPLPTGGHRHMVLSTRAIRGPGGEMLGAVGALTDVSDEREAQARLRDAAAFHDAVLAATPDHVYVMDVATNANVWTSGDLEELIGYSGEEILAMGPALYAQLVHPDDLEGIRRSNAVAVTLADGEVESTRWRVTHKDGSMRWLSRRVTPFRRNADGHVDQLLAVARDITETVEVEQRLQQAALHDPLTGLPNRLLLGDRLATALTGNLRTGQEVAVLFADLDGFKKVNDTGGHAVGDAVLRETADRLRRVLRPEDTVARMGGDEFVIVLNTTARAPDGTGPEAASTSSLSQDAATVAGRISTALAEPIVVDGTAYHVTVSIGVSFARPDDDPDRVLRDADAALYRAKSLGKNRFELFDAAGAL